MKAKSKHECRRKAVTLSIISGQAAGCNRRERRENAKRTLERVSRLGTWQGHLESVKASTVQGDYARQVAFRGLREYGAYSQR